MLTDKKILERCVNVNPIQPMPGESDWRDGFLFLGNQLILDFLNTRPVIDGKELELLTDPAAVRRWLVAAGLLSRRQSLELEGIWPAKASAQLQTLREFRENFRRVVSRLEAGVRPADAFLRYMNLLLAEHPFVDQIAHSGEQLTRIRRFEPRRPLDAMAPILESAMGLLVHADYSRIRKCDSCELHFEDTSKKGTRRWCSMQICGNRAKVAAYTQRRRSKS